MKEFKKLKQLLRKPLFHAWEVEQKGVHTSLLSYYTKKGLIERFNHGIYRSKEAVLNVDFQWEDLILTVKSIPEGIICLTSALALYDLTEEIPRFHWVAIPNSSRAPKRKGVKIVRMRNCKLGKTKIKVGKETITIFNRERTIIDSFRFLGKETAIKALRESLKIRGKNRIDLKKIQFYSKKLRYNIDPYILTITT